MDSGIPYDPEYVFYDVKVSIYFLESTSVIELLISYLVLFYNIVTNTLNHFILGGCTRHTQVWFTAQ